MSRWLIIAALFGFLGVAAGAFGAHGLAERLDAARLATWETASRYQLLHALALLAVAWLASRADASGRVTLAGWAFTGGVLLFSGALYALALSDAGWLGAIAPVGGVLLLVGWVALLSHGAALARRK